MPCVNVLHSLDFVSKVLPGAGLVQDISPLAGLVNLQHLDLSIPQVQDISPLAGVLNLQELTLAYTQVSETAVLELRNTTHLLRIYR